MRRLTALLTLVALAWSGGDAAKIGSVQYAPPAGWVPRVQGELVSLTTAAGASRGVMLVIPTPGVSGDVRAWFEARIKELSSDGQVTDRTEIQSGNGPAGATLLLQGVTLKLAQGAQSRIYTAVVAGKQATMVVLAAPDGNALKAAQPALLSLINSVQLPGQQTAQTAAAGKGTQGTAATANSAPVKLPAVKAQNAAQFKAAGGDPSSAVIPDEFRCYQEKVGSGLTPELTVQVLSGGKYRTAYGSGTFAVSKDGSLRRLAWRGGPLDGAEGYLNFDDYGQTLSVTNVGEGTLERPAKFECYQRGARENLTLLQFKLKIPAVTAYPCSLTDGSGRSGGKLEILPGGTYRLNGQTGRFTVDFRSDQDEDWSDLSFSGGPLDDATGTYQEDRLGVREVSVYRPKMNCQSVAKPTPIPRYGSGRAPAPPKGSGGLSGAYATWYADPLATLGYGGCGGLCWETRFFTKAGYVYTEEPESSVDEADCSRTHPNGLPVCEVYRVQGGKITIGSDQPEVLKRSGANLIIGGRTYTPLLSLQGVKLNGQFEAQTFYGGGTNTTSAAFQNRLVFTPQGTFTQARHGGMVSTATDTGTTAGNVIGGVSASSQRSSAGSYRVQGFSLELRFGDGHVERRFAYVLPGKNGKPDLDLLRIGGLSYTRK
ncbi:hypothetical protein [Deinococcus maricopensis]|uniref:Uncharacterized protein n=1 Tax=Deinococcus maricopensis (strain DSM 21211 / LMG 22137 / NRRL B-23946 / LB-34) TaxID=709986 RepID=E8U2Z5_DEIML|nr:hypothetical protein [Deinococcus maricopensis]ADV65733.1 hypothetical protein Deima_0069 [Deinococcus maricopensis DSM 21211]